MAIDRDEARSVAFDPFTVTVERGQLVFFAKATGQNDPVYTDLAAANAVGHPDLPVPPTFFFSLELAQPDQFRYLGRLGVDPRHVLHGEQSFSYHAMAYAGDAITVTQRIEDAYSKKGGALDFLVKRTDFTRGGELIAEASTVLVVRNPVSGGEGAVT